MSFAQGTVTQVRPTDGRTWGTAALMSATWATSLSIASQGNVTTQTLKAFNEEEYKKIIGSLP